jgi:hypothetical protein
MNSRNERLKIIIIGTQAVGLIVTLISSFIGGLYIFKGEWLYAVPISIIFVVSIYYLVIFFCREKENRRKKGYPPIFFYLFGLYAIMSIVLSFFVLHFYNVEMNEKQEIQSNGTNKINGVKLIYTSYDEQYNDFLNKLEADINSKITSYNNYPNTRISISNDLLSAPYNLDQVSINSIAGSTSPSNAVKTNIDIRRQGFINHKQKILTNENKINLSSHEEFIDEQKNIIDNWDRLQIGKSLNELNERINKDYVGLNNYLIDKTNNNYKIDFEIKNYINQTLMDKPLILASKHFGIGSILVVLMFQLLILLPYFLTRGRMFGF